MENAKEAEEALLPAGRESVLIIDDEPHTLTHFKKILEGFGYHVSACASGEIAMNIFQKAPEKWDLVMTDMSMPGMTGTELAGQILGISPETPLIMCTGHPDLITETQAEELGFSGYINKPVMDLGLANCVRSLPGSKS